MNLFLEKEAALEKLRKANIKVAELEKFKEQITNTKKLLMDLEVEK